MNEKIAQSWPHCQAPLCENLFFCPSEQIYFVALQCSNELLFAIMSTNFLDRLESAGVLLCVAWLLNAAVEFDLSRFSPLLTRFFQEKHLIQFLANKMQDFGISESRCKILEFSSTRILMFDAEQVYIKAKASSHQIQEQGSYSKP